MGNNKDYGLDQFDESQLNEDVENLTDDVGDYDDIQTERPMTNQEYEQYADEYYTAYGAYPEGYDEYFAENYGSYKTTRFTTSEENEIREELTKKQIKEIDKKNKELRKKYHVSNLQIVKNYKNYSYAEKEHYRYMFGKRVAGAVWPFFHYVILIGLAFVILYPILFMATNAIRPQEETSDPSVMWIPKTVTFENFTDAFEVINTTQSWNTSKGGTETYGRIWINTFVINVGCSVVQVLTCALAGYGFARFKFKGRGALFGLVVLQMIVPIQIIMIPVFLQFRYFDFFGILNLIGAEPINLIDRPITMFIMAFFCNGIRAGLFILLFRQFFRGLPKELEDAAYLDGCSPLATFIRVMAPNAFVSFLTVFIFSVVWYWNDTFLSGMLVGGSPTIALAVGNLWREVAFSKFGTYDNVGNAGSFIVWVQAGCLITITPILLMYALLQKHFVEGVERSGIVG